MILPRPAYALGAGPVDNTELLTNSRDNTIKLIDLRMFNVIRTFSADTYRTGMNWAKSDFSPDGEYVVAGSQDGSVMIWNAHTGKLEKTLRGHTYVLGISAPRKWTGGQS